MGGRTVTKGIKYVLNIVQSFNPDIVIMQLGTNDLSSSLPLQVGCEIGDFFFL